MTQQPQDTKTFLRNIPIFGGLQDHGLDQLLRLLEEKTFAVGESVLRQGDTARSMFIVRAGEVVVRRAAPSGMMMKVVRLGPGEFFGETTLIEIHPSDVSIVVERPAVLYALSNRALYQLYQQDQPAYTMVVLNIARELSRRLRKAEARVCELADAAADDEHTQIGHEPAAPVPLGDRSAATRGPRSG